MVPVSHIGGDVTIADPNETDVENAVRSLGGPDRTFVSINPRDGDTWMGIGGGRDGRYVVFIQNEHYVMLVNEDADRDDEIELPICGQIDSWPRRHVVDLVQVLKAVKTFLETGRRDTSLIWE